MSYPGTMALPSLYTTSAGDQPRSEAEEAETQPIPSRAPDVSDPPSALQIRRDSHLPSTSMRERVFCTERQPCTSCALISDVSGTWDARQQLQWVMWRSRQAAVSLILPDPAGGLDAGTKPTFGSLYGHSWTPVSPSQRGVLAVDSRRICRAWQVVILVRTHQDSASRNRITWLQTFNGLVPRHDSLCRGRESSDTTLR
jgi:hypothetical protein